MSVEQHPTLARHVTERFRALQAEFRLSVPDEKKFPVGELPEFAFLGRSNVGKSSLINALCGRKNLARVGKTPGKTRLANFYEVRLRPTLEGATAEDDRLLMFVDFPGYGFAKVSQSEKASWHKMIDRYVLKRDALQAVVLLIDSRRDPGEEEVALVRYLKPARILIAVTKSDKIPKAQMLAAKKRIASALHLKPAQVLMTSTADSKIGVGMLRDELCTMAYPE